MRLYFPVVHDCIPREVVDSEALLIVWSDEDVGKGKKLVRYVQM